MYTKFKEFEEKKKAKIETEVEKVSLVETTERRGGSAGHADDDCVQEQLPADFRGQGVH
jgi:hypothetical protein